MDIVCTRNVYPHHASCAPCVWVWPDHSLQEIVSWSVKCVDHTHCLTPHVAALALPALTAPLAHTLT